MIVTPNVRKEVRRHFSCDDLEGAELEDQGEDGTALTHWEKRVFEVRISSLYIIQKYGIHQFLCEVCPVFENLNK